MYTQGWPKFFLTSVFSSSYCCQEYRINWNRGNHFPRPLSQKITKKTQFNEGVQNDISSFRTALILLFNDGAGICKKYINTIEYIFLLFEIETNSLPKGHENREKKRVIKSKNKKQDNER